jgi:outer membrane protein assembly factor BamE
MRKLLLLLLVLTGCRQVPIPLLPGLSPYKIDIQQGNYVTQDMVAKLKPGMSKSQVRFALGTPLIVDAFHADRWDYIYVLQKGGRVTEQRRIVAVFEGDKLLRIEGDIVPSNSAAALPVPDAEKSNAAPRVESAPAHPEPSRPATGATSDAPPAERPAP